MNLPLRIALRYLFSPKSHNVINVISAVSAVGMALGTAALVLILSVYNGFNKVIDDNLSSFDADVLLCRSDGVSAFDEMETAVFTGRILRDTAVLSAGKRLEMEALLKYDGSEGVGLVRGIEDASLRYGEIPLASVGASLAVRLGVNPQLSEFLEISYIDRSKPLVVSNPGSALRKEWVFPGSCMSVSSETDDRLVLVPLETVRSLFGDGQALSGVEIRLKDQGDRAVRQFIRKYSGEVPDGFRLLDRRSQHPELYRMMRLEKAAVFIILIIVVLIVALNIFGSLSMLIIEKGDDIATLDALGVPAGGIRKIFVLEGVLVSMLGMIVGLVIGVAVALIQQHFGFVKMPGNYLVDAYPVMLKWGDVLITAVGVSLIGLLVSLFPSNFGEE